MGDFACFEKGSLEWRDICVAESVVEGGEGSEDHEDCIDGRLKSIGRIGVGGIGEGSFQRCTVQLAVGSDIVTPILL